MFSSTEKWEKAADHYRKAGNFFKAAMKCETSTRCLENKPARRAVVACLRARCLAFHMIVP